MEKISINQIQTVLRDFIGSGRIEDAIERFKSYLKNENITDRYISDTLINISSTYRATLRDYTIKTIDFQVFSQERNKITEGLLILVRDLPFIKPKIKEVKTTSIQRQSFALRKIEENQERNIIELRGDLISSDKMLINLIKEKAQKEKELVLQQGIHQIEVLKKEIQYLNEKIELEENKYAELKDKYDEVIKEQEQMGELIKEVDSLKNQIEVKNNHISVLEERFVFNEKMLKQQDAELMTIRRKAIEVSEHSIIIKKDIFWKSIIFGLVLIIFLLIMN